MAHRDVESNRPDPTLHDVSSTLRSCQFAPNRVWPTASSQASKLVRLRRLPVLGIAGRTWAAASSHGAAPLREQDPPPMQPEPWNYQSLLLRGDLGNHRYRSLSRGCEPQRQVFHYTNPDMSFAAAHRVDHIFIRLLRYSWTSPSHTVAT